MGDHVHAAGEWMISLRAMRMHMDGMRDGTQRLSSSEVLSSGTGTFPVTPTEMNMDMLMLGAMYAPTDELTLMAMLPYVRNEMDHRTATNVEFTTRSEGLGDLRVSGLYQVVATDDQSVHLNLGARLPTGSVVERDDTPAMANAKLPYPMQLGTGTYDVLPGLTYRGQSGPWSWGAQGSLRLHLGTSSEGYRRGNRTELSGWVARRLGSLSGSFRLLHQSWENFHGADSDLNPGMVPTANPALQRRPVPSLRTSGRDPAAHPRCARRDDAKVFSEHSHSGRGRAGRVPPSSLVS